MEPVKAPASPLHLVAQQMIAICLQDHRVGDQQWARYWNGLAPFDQSAEPILHHLLDNGFLDHDDGMLFIGPEAERRFGRRHFMALTAAFTAPPQFTVYVGRSEIGRIDPTVLTEESPDPRRLLLAGRSWQVTHIDWTRHRVFVEPAGHGGVAGLSFALTQTMREVMLGENPPVRLTRRATARLAGLRDKRAAEWVHPGGTLIARVGSDVRWWTWGGYRANATLAATLASVADQVQRPTDAWVRLRTDLTSGMWHEAARSAANRTRQPTVDARAVKGLKFAAALPPELATDVVARRLADFEGAQTLLEFPVRLNFH